MHVVQMLDRPARAVLVEAAARLLAPGGDAGARDHRRVHSDRAGQRRAAAASRTCKEIDGWVFSSEPLWVQVTEETITARRLRERVAPDGALERSVHDDVLHRTGAEDLERLGAELGLRRRQAPQIRSGPIESDSIVVLLEAP